MNCDVWESSSIAYDAVVANNFLLGEPIVFAADARAEAREAKRRAPAALLVLEVDRS